MDGTRDVGASPPRKKMKLRWRRRRLVGASYVVR
jgi:hypothetical protein